MPGTGLGTEVRQYWGTSSWGCRECRQTTGNEGRALTGQVQVGMRAEKHLQRHSGGVVGAGFLEQVTFKLRSEEERGQAGGGEAAVFRQREQPEGMELPKQHSCNLFSPFSFSFPPLHLLQIKNTCFFLFGFLSTFTCISSTFVTTTAS